MYLPSTVPTIHFVFFFVPFASALLMIVVRSSSVSNAKRAFLDFSIFEVKMSGGFVMLFCSFPVDSTQVISSSSVISSLISVTSWSVIKSLKISRLKFGKIHVC